MGVSDISCPECKKIDPAHAIDQVRKVSAVADNGTPLGRTLSVPEMPSLPMKQRHVFVPQEKPILVLPEIREVLRPDTPRSLLILEIIGIILLVASWAGALSLALLGLWALACVIVIPGFVAYFALIRPARKYHIRVRTTHFNQAMQRYEQAVQEQEQAEQKDELAYELVCSEHAQAVEIYESAESVWNELYYCPRQDGIYVPLGCRLLYFDKTPVPDGVLVPRQEMKAFCRFPLPNYPYYSYYSLKASKVE